MTKLLMLTTSLAGGGAERVASELSLHLNSNFHRRIVTITNNISYTSNKAPISMNLQFSSDNYLQTAYELILSIKKYKKIVKSCKPDVSLSFLVLDNIINILSNIGNSKTKTILSVHVSLSRKFSCHPFFPLIRVFIKILYNNADLIIAVSEGVKEEIINDFGIKSKKIQVINNPIDIKKIEILSQEEITDEKWFKEDIPIIVNVGRLVELKGQRYLIRAFSHVRKEIKCKLCIIGEGPLIKDLQTLVNDLNLSNDVKFLGWKENPFKYIHRSSLFVLSSLSEALPYALIEALACGCPVISTDCNYGPREILGENEYGILVPPMDGKFRNALEPLSTNEKCLSRAIITFLENSELRGFYNQKSKERAMNFKIEKCIEKYENILYD